MSCPAAASISAKNEQYAVDRSDGAPGEWAALSSMGRLARAFASAAGNWALRHRDLLAFAGAVPGIVRPLLERTG